jgi:GAF domain-containing protein
VTRETQLADAFVELAGAMVSGRDVIEVLHLLCTHAVTLLDVSAAGVMLADESDHLHAVAASDERTHLLEILALQHEEGPCVEAFRTGAIVPASATQAGERWPGFYSAAAARGYQSFYGIPLQIAGEMIGAMNLFGKNDAGIADNELRLAQALADVVTIALLQRRERTQTRKLATNLQTALTSRVLIEQAKGALAQRLGIPPENAFELLRTQARDSNRKLNDVAHDIINDVTAIA